MPVDTEQIISNGYVYMTKFVKSLKFGKNGEKYVIKDDNAHAKIEALKAKVDSLKLPDVSNLITKDDMGKSLKGYATEAFVVDKIKNVPNTFFYEVLNDD